MHATSGQTVLIVTVLFVALTVIVTGLFATSGVSQYQNSRDFLYSQRSFFSAESALEDFAYRDASGVYPRPNLNPSGEATPYVLSGFPPASISLTQYLNEASNTYVVTAVDNGVVRKNSFSHTTVDLAKFRADLHAGAFGIEMKQQSKIVGSVFSNGPIIGQNSATIAIKSVAHGGTGKVEVAKPPNPVPPAVNIADLNPEVGITIGNVASLNVGAQQFIAGRSGKLDSVVFDVKKVGSIGTNLDVIIRRNDDRGTTDPNDDIPLVGVTALGSYTVDRSGITTSYTTFSPYFSSQNIDIIAGQAYWVLFKRVNGCSGTCDHYVLRGTTANPYDPLPSQWRAELLHAADQTSTIYYQASGGPYDMKLQVNVASGPGSISGVHVHQVLMTDDSPPTFDPTCEGVVTNDIVACPNQPACSDLVEVRVQKIQNNTLEVNAYYENQTGYFVEGTGSSCTLASGKVTSASLSEFSDEAPTPFASEYIEGIKSTAKKQDAYGNYLYKCDQVVEGCDAYGDFTAGESAIYPVDNAEALYVDGDFTVSGKEIFIDGLIYVTGNLTFSSVCDVSIPDAAPEQTYFILVEGSVKLQGSCLVEGKPSALNAGSHIIIISLSSSLSETDPAITLESSATADVVHAENGLLYIKSSGGIKGAYGAKIVMESSAVVTSLTEGVGNVILPDVGLGGVEVPANWGETP